MSTGDVVAITVEAIWLVIKCSAPMLITSLIIGLIISIFQTVTSIQEQTLTFVPKILAVFVTMLLLGAWMLGNMTDYTIKLWSDFSIYI